MNQITELVKEIMQDMSEMSALYDYGGEVYGHDYTEMAFKFLERLHDLKIIDAEDLLRTMAREITDNELEDEDA